MAGKRHLHCDRSSEGRVVMLLWHCTVFVLNHTPSLKSLKACQASTLVGPCWLSGPCQPTSCLVWHYRRWTTQCESYEFCGRIHQNINSRSCPPAPGSVSFVCPIPNQNDAICNERAGSMRFCNKVFWCKTVQASFSVWSNYIYTWISVQPPSCISCG